MRKVIELMPEENLVFIADQARLPYGDRSVAEIKEFTWQMVHFLLKKNVKAIVFACNTATAAALDEIAPQLDIPVIGVIQSGSLAATKVTQNGHVGVIGTRSTIDSMAYEREIGSRLAGAQVMGLATPKLVPLIESGNEVTPINQELVDSLQPFADSDIDTLVLGCTHYPLIAEQIQKNVSSEVRLVDPADQTAIYTRNVLLQRGLLRTGDDVEREYFTTGEPTHFALVAKKWLHDQNLAANKVMLDA